MLTVIYIFPVGKIDDKEKQFYISTYNGAKNVEDFQNTVLRVKDKLLQLKDLVIITKSYEDSSTMYSFDGKDALSLVISQLSTGDAIQIAEDIKKIVQTLKEKYPDIIFAISNDNSSRIKDRLNTVMSNILFGIILITFLVMILINARMAFIISIGIPTSFVISAIYIYFSGYTINMMFLVGVLIALGIVVDDAIVVSENIQQHIENGMPAKEAAFVGTKEMVGPVTIASITTLFAFLPSLMISGTLGEVIKLVPIALSTYICIFDRVIYIFAYSCDTYIESGSKSHFMG
ncbi:MAG TPA: efflux RND transporter permease subunit [Sulfurovum sp.]|nr:efflux RND transporter permease subunit [Sulfurovum sp.]